MKKMICMMMVMMLIVSLSTAAWAEGRRSNHHRGDGYRCVSRGGGVSTSDAILIGGGMFVLGIFTGVARANANQQEQYVDVGPQYILDSDQQYQYVLPNHPTFMRGTCFPQGGRFPNGVMITTMGYYPPGMATPGFCFE